MPRRPKHDGVAEPNNSAQLTAKRDPVPLIDPSPSELVIERRRARPGPRQILDNATVQEQVPRGLMRRMPQRWIVPHQPKPARVSLFATVVVLGIAKSAPTFVAIPGSLFGCWESGHSANHRRDCRRFGTRLNGRLNRSVRDLRCALRFGGLLVVSESGRLTRRRLVTRLRANTFGRRAGRGRVGLRGRGFAVGFTLPLQASQDLLNVLTSRRFRSEHSLEFFSGASAPFPVSVDRLAQLVSRTKADGDRAPRNRLCLNDPQRLAVRRFHDRHHGRELDLLAGRALGNLIADALGEHLDLGFGQINRVQRFAHRTLQRAHHVEAGVAVQFVSNVGILVRVLPEDMLGERFDLHLEGQRRTSHPTCRM